MRQDNLKFKKINIKQTGLANRPSCFVVDLKENLDQIKENDIKLKNQKNNLKKAINVFHQVNQKVKKTLISVSKRKEHIINTKFHDLPNQKNFTPFKGIKILIKKICFTFLYFLKKYKINQLAFIELIKFIFKVIKKILVFFACKICFYIGWTTLFLIRFVYLVLAILLKLFIKPFKQLIIFIGKIIFYSVAKLGKINYAFWLIIVKSWGLVKQKIYFKLLIISKIFKQKKFSINQKAQSRVNIFKISLYKNLSVKNFLPRPNLIYLKPVKIFALALLILILPFKANLYYKSLNNVRGQVLNDSEQAVNQLLSAEQSASNLNFDQAQKNFSQASDNFLSAQNKLSEINGLLLALVAIAPDKNLRLATVSKRLLQAGQLSAELGKNLSLAITSPCKNGNSNPNGLKEILDNFRLYGHLAVNQALELNNLLISINKNDLPNQYSQNFSLLKEKTAILVNSLTMVIGLSDKLDSFLGATSDKRYLLVFQNNAELRASGGFIGSFALLDFSNGKLKNIEAPGNGSYDIKAGILDKIIAPQPLQLIAPQWYFWDANWWADWPASANKLMWFYEKSDGPTVDGVISFTPTVIENLLKIIGPIDLTEQYGIVFDADNFWIKTQTLAEQKADKTNQPKKIINDLMNKIIAELPARINKNNLTSLLKITDQLFNSKQILFYFTDIDLENKIIELGWDGGFKETNKDYLAVINTNIAGGKSDRKIEETINHQAKIMSDGTIIDTVKITRTHTAVAREPFSGVRNVDWMRIYTPKGSQLLSAQGFKAVNEIYFKKPDSSWQVDQDIFKTENNTEIDETSGTKIYKELNKTVFANWSQVDPGQSAVITLEYKLPFKINKIIEPINYSTTDKIISHALSLINPGQKQLFPYSLLIQKQPGAKADQITANLILNDFAPVWKYPKGLAVDQTGWQINDDLNSDKFWAVLLEEK
ncbi:MAG: DUF4012 domain-containing protein [Patescibacteria group bacterium]